MDGWDSPFNVDRATGLIAGGPANNVTYPMTEVVFTPPDSLFYVVSKSGDGKRSVNLLSVRDFTPGARKPFLFVNASWVFQRRVRVWRLTSTAAAAVNCRATIPLHQGLMTKYSGGART